MNAIKQHILLGVLSFALTFVSLKLNGQDLENIDRWKDSGVSLSGNVSIGSTIMSNSNNNSNPFSYFISANPTLSIYGLDFQVSLAFRERTGSASISHPFNRLSINPRYKWISINFGKFNKSLSSYSLSNQLVTGGAVDLTPDIFRVSFVTGKLSNPITQLDTLIDNNVYLPEFERRIIAAKAGIGFQGNHLDFVVMQVKDDDTSLNTEELNLAELNPEENLIVGTNLKATLIKNVTLKGEVMASSHTANQGTSNYFNSPEIESLRDSYAPDFTINNSTRLNFALSGELDIRSKRFGIGAEYTRIDPSYTSLGAIYFQDDFENYLLRTRFSLFKGKFKLSGRYVIPDSAGFLGVHVTDEDGFYRFENLAPGNYVVFVWQVDNWWPGEPLEHFVSSEIFEHDANNDVDFDNNGFGEAFADIFSGIVTLTVDGEPLNDGDPESCLFDFDAAGNNSVDFGFYDPNVISSTDNTNSDFHAVYPNPSSDVFYISRIEANTKIELYDMVGKKQMELFSHSDHVSIDGSRLANGIYILKFLNEEDELVESTRIIKQ